jgi:hypothetical protein
MVKCIWAKSKCNHVSRSFLEGGWSKSGCFGDNNKLHFCSLDQLHFMLLAGKDGQHAGCDVLASVDKQGSEQMRQ